MSPDIYERLFLFAMELEGEAGVAPPFRYIITTTTPPPRRVATKPFLSLRLAGSPAEDRLFKRDL